MKITLDSINWQHKFSPSSTSLQDKCILFTETIHSVVDHFCPLSKSNQSTNKKLPWVSDKIVQLQNKIIDLSLLMKTFPHLVNLKHRIKKYKSELRLTIKTARIQSNQKLISGAPNKIKAIWNVVKKETGNNKKSINMKISHDDKIIDDPVSVVNLMNNYFTSSSSSLCQSTVTVKQPLVHFNHSHTFFAFPATQDEIINIVKRMKNSHSVDHDGLSSSILKQISSSIAAILAELFNESLSHGLFPNVFKIARVVPILKKGNSQVLDNYRAISLVPTMSKVFELLMLDRLNSFLEKHQILTSTQFGFRKNLSTELAVFYIFNEVLTKMNEKCFVAGLSLDLRKAFDSVDHDILVAKLFSFGIRGKILDWFRSYLQDRYQYVSITDNQCGQIVNSSQLPVSTGVPQGSILGPLLFLLYINDLPSCLSQGTAVLYADDTSVILSAETLELLENKCLSTTRELQLWLSVNKLQLNVDKTNYMMFGKNNCVSPSLHLTYNNQQIQSVDYVKILGITIQSDLSFNKHIDQLVPKLSKAIYTLRVLKKCVSHDILLTAYHAYFNSLMKYGIIFWGNHSDAKKIFILQKKAIRILLHEKSKLKYPSCRGKFKKLKILTQTSLYIFEAIKFIINNPSLRIKNNQVHSHDTRQKDKLHNSVCYNKRTARGVLYSGTMLFNCLPSDFSLDIGRKKFCQKLKEYLITNEFYSLDEFTGCNTVTL